MCVYALWWDEERWEAGKVGTSLRWWGQRDWRTGGFLPQKGSCTSALHICKGQNGEQMGRRAKGGAEYATANMYMCAQLLLTLSHTLYLCT